MTSEDLEKIKVAVKRAEEIVGTLEHLRTASGNVYGSLLRFEDRHSGSSHLGDAELRIVLAAGITARIAALEAELGGIQIGTPPAAPKTNCLTTVRGQWEYAGDPVVVMNGSP